MSPGRSVVSGSRGLRRQDPLRYLYSTPLFLDTLQAEPFLTVHMLVIKDQAKQDKRGYILAL